MAHRFPIAEIIESWGGNYTVQAEVVLSKYHYHQIRMKGWSGWSARGWRRPRGEAPLLTLHLSQCPPRLAHCSAGAPAPYITLTQTRGGWQVTAVHQRETSHMMIAMPQPNQRINKLGRHDGVRRKRVSIWGRKLDFAEEKRSPLPNCQDRFSRLCDVISATMSVNEAVTKSQRVTWPHPRLSYFATIQLFWQNVKKTLRVTWRN